MCELLNRIWSRPRGEWTRVLRKELPALAAGIVEELRDGIPGFSELIEDIDEDVVRRQVEAGLLATLGYVEPAVPKHEQQPAPRNEDRDGRTDPAPDPDRDPDRDRDQHQQPHRGRLAPLTVVARDGLCTTPERARRELFTALTGDMTMSEIALVELARTAGWPLPSAVRAIALASPGETQQLAAVLEDGLAGMVGAQPCLLVPSPDPDPDPDARTALEAALRGRFAAVGHTVALRDTASSLRWALRLLSLTPARAGLDARPVFVDDHLSTLLLLQDEPLAHALAARWLRPLANLTPRQSERLEVTLLAWLEGGGAPEAAKALSVHPQTVRYRMRQLEKLFGPGLRDPRTRFELEMALRSRRLMAQVRRQHSRVTRRARAVTTEFRPPLGVGRMARVNGL
ncbi:MULTISPECIES: CdaR family transcriptional regulator [unclassified Streptomyces]|uniref:PucR family transcriptional regulator n=1 Tax=unclassified Streptomyces TaxID=2593676 RepID=UPI001BEC0F1B|nr:MULTISPECIES: PucR family transcriptional regulator [unclassified Streptomyces]MBT2403146.1 helix-turn-helix domain-containing protein [Streptomyces sp. ISL-21]MBT2610177.1 helix-turn-helix domain-containing protein [Streptomyces sp. ISL-87]